MKAANKIPSLSMYMALLSIMHDAYDRLTDTDNCLMPLVVEDSECEGIAGRYLSCSYSFVPVADDTDIYTLNITLHSNKKDIDFSTNIFIRINTNASTVLVDIDQSMLEYTKTIEDAINSFFLDYNIYISIR